MTHFTPLPRDNGYGNIHINRFRICVKPTLSPAQIATIGRDLPAGMLKYMNSNTASVKVGSNAWNGHDTLKFRGVAKLKPFREITALVPDKVLDWAMPDIHTDSVGIVSKSADGFTVQTLKRDFEDADDATIRTAVSMLVNGVTTGSMISPVVLAAIAVLRALGGKKYLQDLAVFYNQHHFLAGRRSFRFDIGSTFGYKDDRLVFETAAVERFSNKIFAQSEIAMGDMSVILRAVWGEMLTQFCKVHGLKPITEKPQAGWSVWPGSSVHYQQFELPGGGGGAAALGAILPLTSRHKDLI
jgi:hypothetical protein